MVREMVGAKPLLELMMKCCQLDPYKQTSLKFKFKFLIFVQEKTLKIIVWKMVIKVAEDDIAFKLAICKKIIAFERQYRLL